MGPRSSSTARRQGSEYLGNAFERHKLPRGIMTSRGRRSLKQKSMLEFTNRKVEAIPRS